MDWLTKPWKFFIRGHAKTDEMNENANGSDEIEDMYCEMCKSKGKSCAADGFCVDCVKYFCSTCMAYHREFLPNHKHQDKTGMPRDVCVKPCSNHRDEIIKFYCHNCEKFLCSRCKVNEHGSCQGKSIVHLPSFVQKIDMSKTYSEVNNTLISILKDVEKRESEVRKRSQLVDRYAAEAKSALYLEKSAILEWLNKNVSNVEKEIEKIQSEDRNALQVESYVLSRLKDKTSRLQTVIEQTRVTEKRCEMFIALKNAEINQKEIEKRIIEVKEHGVPCYEFKASGSFEKLLRDRLLGSITKKLNTTSSESGKVDNAFVPNTCTRTELVPDIGKPILQTCTDSKSSMDTNILNATMSYPQKDMEASNTALDGMSVVGANVYEATGEFPDVKEQRTKINKGLQQPLAEGELRYIVDMSWFEQWQIYVGLKKYPYTETGLTRPGPIDNSGILHVSESLLYRNQCQHRGRISSNSSYSRYGSREYPDGNPFKNQCVMCKSQLAHTMFVPDHPVLDRPAQLKTGLCENQYILLPEDSWRYLLAWYGMVKGQEPLPRKVVCDRRKDTTDYLDKQLKVDLYPLSLLLRDQSNSTKQIERCTSLLEATDMLEKEMRAKFGIAEHCQVRLLRRNIEYKYELLGSYLEARDKVIVIEQKNQDGTWPVDLQSDFFFCSRCYGYPDWSEKPEFKLFDTDEELEIELEKEEGRGQSLCRPSSLFDTDEDMVVELEIELEKEEGRGQPLCSAFSLFGTDDEFNMFKKDDEFNLFGYSEDLEEEIGLSYRCRASGDEN